MPGSSVSSTFTHKVSQNVLRAPLELRQHTLSKGEGFLGLGRPESTLSLGTASLAPEGWV